MGIDGGGIDTGMAQKMLDYLKGNPGLQAVGSNPNRKTLRDGARELPISGTPKVIVLRFTLNYPKKNGAVN